MPEFPKVSIIIPTYKSPNTVVKTVRAMLKQDYPAKFEIIVVNDASPDDTREKLVKEFGNDAQVHIVNMENNSGVCRARNEGIKRAKNEIVINMDHDCVPGKKWLMQMVKGFDSDDIGIVSGYDYYGGTSTGFRKNILEKVGGYDEEYVYYREDTDLSFKIMDLGYKFKLVKADYIHEHEEVKPEGLWNLCQYVMKRLYYHQNDVLLYKMHPNKTTEDFLHIKYGFLVDPVQDFKVATGTWEKEGKYRLSSPRGITFLENKSPFHALLIAIFGIGYVFAVKFSRLIGSIRFGKLLV